MDNRPHSTGTFGPLTDDPSQEWPRRCLSFTQYHKIFSRLTLTPDPDP